MKEQHIERKKFNTRWFTKEEASAKSVCIGESHHKTKDKNHSTRKNDCACKDSGSSSNSKE